MTSPSFYLFPVFCRVSNLFDYTRLFFIFSHLFDFLPFLPFFSFIFFFSRVMCCQRQWPPFRPPWEWGQGSLPLMDRYSTLLWPLTPTPAYVCICVEYVLTRMCICARRTSLCALIYYVTRVLMAFLLRLSWDALLKSSNREWTKVCCAVL